MSILKKQEKDSFNIPMSVQQVIPIKKIWTNGIFLIGKNQYSLTYRFTLRRIYKKDFEKEILLPFKEDGLDIYRKEYNQMLLDKSINSNSMVREIYLTVTTFKKDYEEARNYFKRIGNDIVSHLAKLGRR